MLVVNRHFGAGREVSFFNLSSYTGIPCTNRVLMEEGQFNEKNGFIILIISLLIFLFCLCVLFSYKLLFLINGFSIKNTTNYERETTRIGKEIISVFQTQKNNKPIIVIAAKKGLFWTVDTIQELDDKGEIETYWVKSKGVARYSATELPVFSYEYHFVFYGNNASSKLTINKERLNDNVSVNLNQAGREYWVDNFRYCRN